MATIAASLANELGLTREKRIYYGEYRGFAVSVRDLPAGQAILEIGAAFDSEQEKRTFIGRLLQPKECKRLSAARPTGAGVALTFAGGPGAKKAVCAYMDTLWHLLERLSARGAQVCPLCGLELSEYTRVWAKIGDEVYCAHGSCIERRAEQAREQNREAAMEKKNVLPGALGAFFGALAGMIPWVIVYLIGYLSAWCGLFIGLAAKKGYELAGGKAGKLKPWLIAVSTFVAFALSFFVIQAAAALFDFFKYYDDYTYWGWTAPIIIKESWLYFVSEEFWRDNVSNVGMGFIFAVAGCAGVFVEARKESRGPGAEVEYIHGKTSADAL